MLSGAVVPTIYWKPLYVHHSSAGMGPRPRRLGLETVSRPIHGLVAVSSRRYVQMSRSRLGLESWRLGLGLGLDLSGLEPIAIFTQIYLRRFVTKTLSPHKLNRSVNINPMPNAAELYYLYSTSSLWYMTSFVLAKVFIAEVKSKLYHPNAKNESAGR